MVGHQARRVSDWRHVVAPALPCALVACVGATVAFAPHERINALTSILAVGAVCAGLMAVGTKGSAGVSASFLVYVLAGVFLGARSAIAAAVVSELVIAVVRHTQLRTVLLINLPACVVPAIAGALLSYAIAGRPADSATFYLAVAAASLLAISLSFAIFVPVRWLFMPQAGLLGIRTFLDLLPNTALNVLLVVAGAGIAVKLGKAGIAFALSAVFTFSYMAHLLNEARQRAEEARVRAEQYASLSWGVLSGLMRSLDVRDKRHSRHAAAVAIFARDMARAVGMSEQEQELAHTAGLLHDIGFFALSDRVATRGVPLKNEDWPKIELHPELGAEMLKDLGMYGPVAEIVLSHHERPSGFGYPRGLEEHEIPELAKIIAVAEAYDTLTGPETYRTKVSSFEALTELRRVAGEQLDGRYVEVLAGLLAGVGTDYRHADDADFWAELDLERRIKEAKTPEPTGEPAKPADEPGEPAVAPAEPVAQLAAAHWPDVVTESRKLTRLGRAMRWLSQPLGRLSQPLSWRRADRTS